MSRDTLLFLQNVLRGLQLNVGAPDFIEAANASAKALRELDQELANLDHDQQFG